MKPFSRCSQNELASPPRARARRHSNQSLMCLPRLEEVRSNGLSLEISSTNNNKVNDHAKGYPNLAAFLDSDEGFAVYRRFGYLQSRILLQKQDELRSLEEELKETEKSISDEDSDALCRRELHGPLASKHNEILEDIEKAYCSYGMTQCIETP